jgi:excisionase family DNA binding protein
MAVFNTIQTAERLGLSIRRVQSLIKQGLLPATKFGRDWMIESRAVDQLKKKHRPPGRPRKK